MSDEKNKYITAYGSSNADSYGRGDVTDVSTKYDMLITNPLSDENAPEMNSYSSDGSYNQDIFGWKCFNSPVSFRNGIYGECGYVTTFSDSTYHGIKIETYDTGDISNQSKIIIKADHIKLDGEVDDLTADKANKLVYNNGSSITTVITANSATSVIPNTNGTVSLGSSTNKFNKVYSDISLNTSLLFTTQYAVNGADQSEAFTTNLTDPNIAIKLPKCTYITTINGDNVEYVGRGQTNSAINLPENETTYLEVNRVAPGLGDPEKCCIGTSTYRYGGVWANNLHGVVPHVDLTNSDASADIKYPIGCIIKARVSLSAFSSVTARKLPAGTESIRPGTGTIYEMLYDAYNETYITDSTTNLNSMSWKTLISVTRSQGDIELNKTFDIYIIRVG